MVHPIITTIFLEMILIFNFVLFLKKQNVTFFLNIDSSSNHYITNNQ